MTINGILKDSSCNILANTSVTFTSSVIDVSPVTVTSDVHGNVSAELIGEGTWTPDKIIQVTTIIQE